jgi:hypothetical protein
MTNNAYQVTRGSNLEKLLNQPPHVTGAITDRIVKPMRYALHSWRRVIDGDYSVYVVVWELKEALP